MIKARLFCQLTHKIAFFFSFLFIFLNTQCVKAMWITIELCLHVCLCRLLEENRRHQELILGICAEKDNMRDELKKRAETEKLHMSTMQKVCSSPRQVYSHCSQSQTNGLCVSFICSVYTCFSFSDCKHVEDGL